MIIPEKNDFETKKLTEIVESIKIIYKSSKEQGMNLIGSIIDKFKLSQRQASKLFGFCRQTVKKAIDIFKGIRKYKLETEKRGRHKYEENDSELVIRIQKICDNTENVDKSLKDKIIYIDVTPKYIIEKLKSDYNYSDAECPCKNTIIRILKQKLNYKISKVKKNKVAKKIKETDDIFDNVNNKKKEVENSDENTLAISGDDKTVKYIGEFSGNGNTWKQREGLDHDTNPDYIVKPFGIMDLKTKETFVYCTTSNSTADFKVDCIEDYVKKQLLKNLNINKLLIFLDNGPENSSRRKLWMRRIIELSIKYKITIELVYYPPYHSKYNKIEHYWGVLQKHWGGLIIDNLDKLIGAINSCTWDGIYSNGYLIDKIYEKGKKVDEPELENLIKKHVTYENKNIEKWSVIITP